METEYICGLPVDVLTYETIERELPQYINNKEKMLITSVNPQISLLVDQYPQIKHYIKRSTHRIPDGEGVVLMSRLLGGNIKARVTGYDTMIRCLAYANQHQERIFLYGAKPEVVQSAVANIQKDYPNLIVAGSIDGYTSKSEQEIVSEINQSGATFLFVALGAPKQELFLESTVDELKTLVYLDVGGSFDVLAGAVARAPEFFIKLKIEWLYRSVKFNRPERLLQLPKYVLRSLRYGRKPNEY